MSSTEEALQCGSVSREDTHFGLRVASIFIIFVGSSLGAIFPILASRLRTLNVHKSIFEGAKYFGSGVIIATAFIHLLAPAIEQLGSPCLKGTWTEYPWVPAIAMISVFMVFFVELAAFRWGTAKLDALGVKGYDNHGHAHDSAGRHGAHGPETASPTTPSNPEKALTQSDSELGHAHQHVLTDSALAQILGVAILESGVVFHSILTGMTLAVDDDFIALFVVLIFHQTFEGLGLGTRLASLSLPDAYRTWAPYAGALVYGITTPVGIAAGLGIRSSYNPGSTASSIIGGMFDSISAGILLYTGLVELLAHEFIFNPTMHRAPMGKLLYACGMMCFGAALMALLGRWA
ncbi:Zinc-regulated transporter 1 [Ceratobasidium theobromae]|uniref:Zinc-regulated transporter 1 n=1 Tax=Ceratobasidium theobromae TaxID=1582974 RepID=A0A5N5QT22_9AGAM|nr:Zinc-regulated transporter 1 [Ceratobasidium theobromae]